MEIEHLEKNYKSTIEELEDQVARLKLEKENMQLDKDQLEKEMSSDTHNKNVFINEIENLQEKIRRYEEQKGKEEDRNKERVNSIQNEMRELDSKYQESKNQIVKLEKEIKEFKDNKEKRSKDIEEYKAKANNKEKELLSMKNKIDNWEKEKEYLKKDYDEAKRTTEKVKIDYKETLEKMKVIKDGHGAEIKKLEEKISTLEKKLENEKNTIIILTEKVKKAGQINAENKSESEVGTEKSTEGGGLGSLSDVLESAESKENLLEVKNIQLQNELDMLTKKVSELSSKNQSKNNSEIELLKKENNNFKQNIKEMKEMYEQQITDLQKKTQTANADLQSIKRASTKLSVKADPESITKFLLQLADLENKNKEFKAEVTFLNDKIEMLNKDVETQKNLREKDVKFLKEEVRNADNLAVNAKVQLAQIVYEKDDQIMQLKATNKKLKTKLVTLQGGVPTGSTIAPNKK